MPLNQTSGNVTTDAYGGGVAAIPNYIEDVFSTYLYKGTTGAQSINNGIDLSTKGGLLWLKDRSTAGTYHYLADSARGPAYTVNSNTTDAQSYYPNYITSFNTDGFTIGAGQENTTDNRVSWTFRKQPKFFDVVTWTGNGTAGRQIAHNLGSVPGCIMVKRYSGSNESGGIAGYWVVYHRGLSTPESGAVFLNSTDARNTIGTWNNTAPTSTNFTVGDSYVNYSGDTYVAYIFAHDAGGFGLTGTDNVISCGSVVNTGNPQVTLGYEPQWVLFKSSTSTSSWYIVDNMRGLPVGSDQAVLRPNASSAEVTNSNYININATGFTTNSSLFAGETLIYIAIRRGPMKVPTDGTKVFAPVTVNSSASTQSVNAGFPVDLAIKDYRNLVNGAMWFDRLRGITSSTNPRLFSSDTSAESNSNDINGSYQTGVTEVGIGTGYTSIDWFFKRAPSFFDEVCYTGDNAFNRAIPHNLAAVPELVITKVRTTTSNWAVYASATGLGYPMALNTTAAASANPYVWGTTAPTSTNFYVGDDTRTNGGGYTYVSYLFATCAGVSKVGSYTGNGSTQAIACGFAGGARFVLIKRTDDVGNWYVYDTARGMSTLTDPYLLLNSTAAETATLGSVTTTTGGFTVNASILAAINTNGASYIFLAIA